MEPVIETTPVLVVGGSLVGLSAALFLSACRVPTVLVEPHLGSSPHPRAIGYTSRTLELFRSVGLGEEIPQAPPGFRLQRRRVESLAGPWQEATDWTPKKESATPPPADALAEPSPARGAAIAQDQLEPILRERARALGAELRLGTELVRFEQDGAGVTALLRERSTGREYPMRAQYVVAADGGKSPVRETLGIARTGRGHIKTVRSVLFRAPLEEYLASGVHQFEIDQPGLQAFLTTYNDGRWVLMFTDDVERKDDALRAAIQQAIGRTDLPIEILTTGRWELTALIAERFSRGRVFLAGDAAHTLPPTRGGYGANTGIHDAHNLAWKLAAVLSGASAPALLDSYDAERRPVAWVRLLQTFARPDYAREAMGIAEGVEVLDEVAVELGQLYRSGSVLGVGASLPDAARPEVWAGQPGTRAPHRWLAPGVSTLDRFGHGWVLVHAEGHDAERWHLAVTHVAERLGIAVESLRVSGETRASFGLTTGGASLVRPDGVVAWRAAELPADPEAALLQSLSTVTCATRAS